MAIKSTFCSFARMLSSLAAHQSDPQFGRVLRCYYGFNAGIQVLFWAPIFYAYQKLMGLSDAQYFEIQSYYYWIFCFLELPTGWIADRLGYRGTLISSSLVMAASNLSAIFWTSPAGFFFHFILIAIARALTSGAASAYIYEYLCEKDQEGIYRQVEGRARSLSLVARVFAWGSAGFLFDWQPTSPYWLTALACLLAAISCFGLTSLKAEPAKAATKTNFKPVFREVATNRILLYSIIIGAGIFVLTRVSLVNLYQPLMQLKGFDAKTLGLVMSLLTVFEAVGADQAHRVLRWFNDVRGIFISTALVCVSLAVIAFTGATMTVVAFAAFSFFTGIAFPLTRQQVNSAIQEKTFRATLLSAESIIQRVFMGTAAMACSIYAKNQQIEKFLVTASVTVLVVVGFGAFMLRRLSRVQSTR